MEPLGVVGVGRMGGPMATHLLDAGHDVYVYDRDAEAMATLPAATQASSLQELARTVDVLVLSLPGPTAVQAVVEEVIEVLDHGSVIVDTTTSNPSVTTRLADDLATHDISLLSAPVSGGVSGAQAGTLTVMIGGDAIAVERVTPYLESFAETVVHVGSAAGHGHAMKLLNNFLSITAMVATSEAVVLGQTLGLDVETMCAVFNESTGRNSATEDKFPECVTEDRAVGFALGLLDKDISLLTAFAEDTDVPLQLAPTVRAEAGRTTARFGPGGDMTDIYDYVRETTGVELD